MPFCSNCGMEVSKTDKRCSRCGTKIEDEPPKEDFNIEEEATKKVVNAEKTYNNIEFALSIIALIISVFSISQSFFNSYGLLQITGPITILLGLVGTIIIRYYARFGAVILVFTVFALIISTLDFSLAVIFYIIAVILAFVRN